MAHVFETEEQLAQRNERKSQGRPAHWGDKLGTHFTNPWPSWRANGVRDMFSVMKEMASAPSPLKNQTTTGESIVPLRFPTFGLNEKKETENKGKIKSTWLGHACFLVELPVGDGAHRGGRVLFDPVFSHRCSPVQFMGPARFTQPPCKLEEIPEVDAIVISHNHYDHLDTKSIQTLFKRSPAPHIFAPLGNGPYFKSLGIPDKNVHIMDWWDTRRVEVDIPTSEQHSKIAFDITCTPGQHFTGRGIFDRFKTLWAGWAVEDKSSPVGSKVYFAGDTAYRTVLDGQDEDKVPVCPAFKEIGKRFGAFDLALIPIGAYMPRHFMSSIHCAPQDSVKLYQDVNAKRAIGMHWGTWVLTTEDVLEPPKRLTEEVKKAGIPPNAFTVCDIGETVEV